MDDWSMMSFDRPKDERHEQTILGMGNARRSLMRQDQDPETASPVTSSHSPERLAGDRG